MTDKISKQALADTARLDKERTPGKITLKVIPYGSGNNYTRVAKRTILAGNSSFPVAFIAGDPRSKKVNQANAEFFAHAGVMAAQVAALSELLNEAVEALKWCTAVLEALDACRGGNTTATEIYQDAKQAIKRIKEAQGE